MPDKFEPSTGGAFGPGLDYNITGNWRFLSSVEAGDFAVSNEGVTSIGGVAVAGLLGMKVLASETEIPNGFIGCVLTGTTYKLVHNDNGEYKTILETVL